MGIFYAVAMLVIFLIGYTAIPGQMDKLKIVIVNEDAGETGIQIAKQLSESLPFEIESDYSNDKALQKLEDNKIALLIQIPENFSASAQKGESAEINFTVNEASATMVSSSMSTIVKEINQQLSTSFSTQTAQGILMNMNVPEEQAAAMAQQIENAYVGNYVIIKAHHQIPGMTNSMTGFQA